MADDKKLTSEAAHQLSQLGASKGGRARAARLTPEERRESARRAAAARWGSAVPASDELPLAEYGSPDRPLRIGAIEIPCYVLADGRRVLSQRGLQAGMGLSRSAAKSGARRLAHFLGSLERKGLDLEGLPARAGNPFFFVPPRGGVPALAYEATILPEVCEAVLLARREGKLLKQQQHLARQCEILLGGLARSGIIALVDETTGYQDARAHDALAKILEAFVQRELRKWVKTFPTDYLKELFRLRGLKYPPDRNPPQYFGKITNNLVYKRLAPGVHDELKRLNPTTPKGYRKHRHFQHLTEDVGSPRLREHLAAVVALMKGEDKWDVFMRKMDRVFPMYGKTIPLALPEPANN